MAALSRLHIKESFKTPEVTLEPGLIEISGRSIPIDSFEFYDPIIRWLEKYKEEPSKTTNVIFKIEYLNSASNRFIYNILKIMDEIHERKYTVNTKWYYEEDDDSMRVFGIDLNNLLKIPIEIISTEIYS